MKEERFLELYNDLDKVLRKVCSIADGDYADVGSMLAKAKDLSPINPVQANWDNLYVARQLRNLMVHEKRTGLKEVAQPSQELIAVLEKVIAQYESPVTLADYLASSQKARPISFSITTPLSQALEVVDREHFSKFPLFSQTGYQGLLSENGISNWLARSIHESTSLKELVQKTPLSRVLACEEASLRVLTLPASSSLFQLIEQVTAVGGSRKAAVLVSRRKDGTVLEVEDLVGIITSHDLAEIYATIGEKL
ncbi:hypothetical protein JNG37_01755 [Streptococcus suis]|uniref:CBS domain-containing protein n=1 Tax=Streptococcus suis TaxID=1307 RepID=A0A4T2GMM0_STRSU|nr:hypothetical protein [Streptococcus suis]MBM7269617.1 hypothetical protein [Streptococcus suis]TII00376.1 hypothetical protein FAJ39_04745 [Streptococcus suis]